MMKKLGILIFLSCISMVGASWQTVFYDDFNDGILPDGWGSYAAVEANGYLEGNAVQYRAIYNDLNEFDLDWTSQSWRVTGSNAHYPTLGAWGTPAFYMHTSGTVTDGTEGVRYIMGGSSGGVYAQTWAPCNFYNGGVFFTVSDLNFYEFEVLYNTTTDSMTFSYGGSSVTYNSIACPFDNMNIVIANYFGGRHDWVKIEKLCSSNWTCFGYGACNSSDLATCNAVVDQNACGESYGGDYSEFTPQACDYCTPDWSCGEYSACRTKGTKECVVMSDANLCGDTFNGTLSDYDATCIYSLSSNGGSVGFNPGAAGRAAGVDSLSNMSDQQKKTAFLVGGLAIGYFLISSGAIGGKLGVRRR